MFRNRFPQYVCVTRRYSSACKVTLCFFVIRFTPNVVLFAGICIIGFTLALIPFCHSVPGLAIVLAIMGFSMGLIDTTANVSMIQLYGFDVSPFLQVTYTVYVYDARSLILKYNAFSIT